MSPKRHRGRISFAFVAVLLILSVFVLHGTAAGLAAFAAMLGLRLDLPSGQLLIDPALPSWLEEATLHGLEVRGEAVSLSVRRSGASYDVAISGPVVNVAP